MIRAASAGLVYLLVALIGTGCGGGEDGESPKPVPRKGERGSTGPVGPVARPDKSEPPSGATATIRKAITGVLTAAGSPIEGCVRFVTPEFVERSYGDRKGCLAARRSGGLARSVRIKEVSAIGPVGTAIGVPAGGPYDGQRLRITLALASPVSAEVGRRVWRIEDIRANVPVGP